MDFFSQNVIEGPFVYHFLDTYFQDLMAMLRQMKGEAPPEEEKPEEEEEKVEEVEEFEDPVTPGTHSIFSLFSSN